MTDAIAQLAASLPSHKASLHITHDQHKSYYETVEEAIAGNTYGSTDWISDEQRSMAIERDSVWELQWYPQTPVGSCRIIACELGALISHAAEIAAKETK